MKQTQTEMVLDMLRANRLEGITAKEAYYELGISRLAARINDLRDMGHWIDTVMIEVPTRYGKARVANYRLINTRGDKI